MVRRLLKLVKEKLTGKKKEEKGNKSEEGSNQSWEKRKAELMAKARQNDAQDKPRTNRPQKPEHYKAQPKKHETGSKPAPNKNEQKSDQKGERKNEQRGERKNEHRGERKTGHRTEQKKDENTRPNNKPNQRQRPQQRTNVHQTQQPPKKEAVKEPHNWDDKIFDVPAEEGKIRFHDFKLQPELMHAIYDLGFKHCTPIQAAILKSTLEGKDATGRAQTGTGKTAAFLITIINKFLNDPIKGVRRPGAPRALIIAPTRELVMQIASDANALTKYANVSVVEIYGGMDYNKQQRRLRSSSVDILVATPGRLLDFQNKRDVFLGSVETLIIDEADRMLDMGFIPDVRKIINSTPPKAKRQTLFFSATLTDEVKRLAYLWTKDAVNVEIEPEKVAGSSVNQIVYIVTNDEKFPLLYNVIQKENLERVIVFANRKDEAHPLQDMLQKYGITCEVLSGDVDQKKRIRTLSNFKEGKIRVLVATDVASRGIHVDDVSHVVNFTLPQDPEDYVHRIGRTGRAGAFGTSISFASEDDSFNIPAIEKFLGSKLNCIYPEDNLLTIPVLEDIKNDVHAPKEQIIEDVDKPDLTGEDKTEL